ncbi:MAG: S8 family peptidase [Phycisphaerae bacterium]|jgi:hypothetical protein
MAENHRLPIKIVQPMEQDFGHDKGGGGNHEPFVEVTDELRQELTSQVSSVASHFAEDFEQEPDVPAVAVVTLRRNAIAKSYRPTTLFNDDICPSIGVAGLGKLLISVKPVTLKTLAGQIAHAKSKEAKLHISAIEQIAPYSAEMMFGCAPGEFSHLVDQQKGKSLKVRLFRHWFSADDLSVQEAFLKRVGTFTGVRAVQRSYGGQITVFDVKGLTGQQALSLAHFPGVASIGPFPTYQVLVPSSRQVEPADPARFPGPNPSIDYPILGIIDGGIAPANPILAPWVVDRHSDVPEEFRDYDHGSFIAGLVTHGRTLNHDDPRLPALQCRIFDVIAMPKEGATEADLLDSMRTAFAKRRDVRVWSLSVNYANQACANNAFSDFAQALDRLQDEFDVQLVISAGNYDLGPVRTSIGQDLGGADFISPPGDSVRALTVGSLAHKDHPTTVVRAEQPSSFSRRGPGPGFIPKPEVAHYGGNCTATGECSQAGLLSIDGQGHIQEWVGTSFSTPWVAAILGHVHHRIEAPITRNLAKALVVHSAVLRHSGVDPLLLPYRGFGVPGDIDQLLFCTPHAVTLVFEPELEQGPFYEKRNFPMPTCLFRDGRFVGEVYMTLVCDPPLHPQGGIEYCQANVEVSLGVYRTNKAGKSEFHGEIPQVVTESEQMKEQYLIEHCFKYSPVKVFHRDCSRGEHGRASKGVSGNEWRLKMQVRQRVESREIVNQNVALLVTIRDPNSQQPVYDEVVRSMQTNGWIIDDLRVRDRLRPQVS